MGDSGVINRDITDRTMKAITDEEIVVQIVVIFARPVHVFGLSTRAVNVLEETASNVRLRSTCPNGTENSRMA